MFYDFFNIHVCLRSSKGKKIKNNQVLHVFLEGKLGGFELI